MNQETTDITHQDSAVAYKLGILSAEVRILKWVAAIAITANFAFFSFFAQQVNALQAGQIKIMERLTSVEHRLGAVEERLDGFEQRIASNLQQINSHSHL